MWLKIPMGILCLTIQNPQNILLCFFFVFYIWPVDFLITNFLLSTGLSDHDNYHEYCRLLDRLKINYQVTIIHMEFVSHFCRSSYATINLMHEKIWQLSELVSVESYSDWIQLVAEFTIQSLQSWQVCPSFPFPSGF